MLYDENRNRNFFLEVTVDDGGVLFLFLSDASISSWVCLLKGKMKMRFCKK